MVRNIPTDKSGTRLANRIERVLTNASRPVYWITIANQATGTKKTADIRTTIHRKAAHSLSDSIPNAIDPHQMLINSISQLNGVIPGEGFSRCALKDRYNVIVAASSAIMKKIENWSSCTVTFG